MNLEMRQRFMTKQISFRYASKLFYKNSNKIYSDNETKINYNNFDISLNNFEYEINKKISSKT